MNTIGIYTVFTRVGKDAVLVALGEVVAESTGLADIAAKEVYGEHAHVMADHADATHCRKVPYGKDERDVAAEANEGAYGSLQELEFAGVLKGSADDDPISAAAKRRSRVLLGKD